MQILLWISNNAGMVSGLITVLGALFAAFHSVYAANRNLREAIHALMLRAEKAWKNGEFGDVDGDAVMEIVIARVISLVVPRLPMWVRPFITEVYVRKVAQVLYEKAKDYLDDGKFNNSNGKDGASVA